jgi:nucleoside-diphosphate-sugar epimerase
MRALVTGADGFIGQALLPRLRREGFSIRAVTRRPHAVPNSDETVVIGCIDGTTDWRTILTDIDVVVHLAAIAHTRLKVGGLTNADLMRVNVDGTVRLAEASLAAGVRRLIFVSSIKAMGSTTTGKPFEEDDPPAPDDPYGSSKWQAERQLRAMNSRLETTIVRPPLVYGPEVRANFLRLLNVCATGLPLPLGDTAAPRSICFVENLADALALCASHRAAGGKTYFVTDGTDVSVGELVIRLRVLMHRQPLVWALPQPFFDALSRLARRRAAYRSVFCPLQASSERIRQQLGWLPPYSQDEGLARTVEWFMRTHGQRR